MGEGAAAAYLLAAASAGAGMYNQHETAKAQDEQTAVGIRRQGQLQHEADQVVNNNLDHLAKLDTSAEDNAQRRAISLGYPNASSPGSIFGIGGDDFQADSAAANRQVDQFGRQQANLAARIQAPEERQRSEQMLNGRTAADLNMIGRDSAGEDFLTQMRVRGVQPNAGLTFLSDALGGASTAAATRSPKPKKPPAHGIVDPADSRASRKFGD